MRLVSASRAALVSETVWTTKPPICLSSFHRPDTVIRTSADFVEGVILVACLTVTAVAAREVVTDLAGSTAVRPHLTLINV